MLDVIVPVAGAPEAFGRCLDSLLAHTDLDARSIAENALNVAGDICIYTNRNLVIEEL